MRNLVGYSSNGACLSDYLTLFQFLSNETPDSAQCQRFWDHIQEQEAAALHTVQLAPPYLRQQFALCERDFLLVMAALALEMDGALRGSFRRRYGLSFPTLEYGLQLIAPICPSSCETLSQLTGPNPLCSLLLTTAESTAYPLERPFILCRSLVAFLSGLRTADTPGCTLLTPQEAPWLPLHEAALSQVAAWYPRGGSHPLFLCAPAGAGRRTLLRRACGNVVCGDLMELSTLSAADQDHALREMAVLARLLDAPLCAEPDPGGHVKDMLARLCRKHHIPLVFLAETDSQLHGAQEVVRLSRQLTASERALVWTTLVPEALPNTQPDGAMTVGTLIYIAKQSHRLALQAGRKQVTREDTRRALMQWGSAAELGIRYDRSVSMEDLVLPNAVQEQLRLICQAAVCGGRLSEWGLPGYREGVTAVFHGPSGTGKTMAASAIAHTLGMPLLRADLSQIMDKYVGETEKHLNRLLQCAREAHCVLFFDEADSLFGKRTTVATGHDKYANLSTSYLLQEIEQYDGVVLLSTNLLSNFDDAFLRRLQYLVRFSLPDEALREELWKRALPASRRHGAIPFSLLAQAELSPARIHAAVRSAAVAALADGLECVDAGKLIAALNRELEKSGKSLPQALTVYQADQLEVYQNET